MPKIWTAKKCYKDLAAPRSEAMQRFVQKSIDRLKSVTDWRKDMIRVEGDLHILGNQYRSKGVAGWYSGDIAQGLQDLATGLYCEFAEFVLTANRVHFHPDTAWPGFQNEDNQLLAAEITLGRFDYAEIIADKMVRKLAEGNIGDNEPRPLDSFVLRLYLASMGKTETIPHMPTLKFAPYRSVLDHWFDEDPATYLAHGLAEACDYHVAQSREGSDNASYEIERFEYQLFPAEIVAVLRLREQRSLAPVIVDHELMKMATAKLPPISPDVEYPDYIVHAVERLKAEAPEYADGL